MFLTLVRMLLFVVAVAAVPAHAGPADNHWAAASGMTMDQAIAQVRRQHGGQVVSATEGSRDGRRGYRVRVLTDKGRVRTVWVDADGRRGRRG